jgi:hypothetical protein
MGNSASKRQKKAASTDKAAPTNTGAGVAASASSTSNRPLVSKFATFDPNLLKECDCPGARMYHRMDKRDVKQVKAVKPTAV